ncbi:MAG: arginine repressor [Clostridia bacterium]|nr:arginine repressor [Clostridia bacterium]
MSTVKDRRQQKILEIIRGSVIRTQDELATALLRYDISATQATLSRDLRELNVHKIADASGVVRLTSPNNYNNISFNDKFISIISNSYVSVDYANNLVVLRTLSGMAQAAAAVFDSRQYDGILGTVAGDDTILIICRSSEAAEQIVNTLRPFGEDNA